MSELGEKLVTLQNIREVKEHQEILFDISVVNASMLCTALGDHNKDSSPTVHVVYKPSLLLLIPETIVQIRRI